MFIVFTEEAKNRSGKSIWQLMLHSTFYNKHINWSNSDKNIYTTLCAFADPVCLAFVWCKENRYLPSVTFPTFLLCAHFCHIMNRNTARTLFLYSCLTHKFHLYANLCFFESLYFSIISRMLFNCNLWQNERELATDSYW